ncbi:MAG: hypothetical protein H6823_08230 [Planctomycetaceae bacterium]|nr:hypothetical protein [Planctomycetales bacterium]MCB9938214.1 hypothetical protein [Planctomycetaceae bacterium]
MLTRWTTWRRTRLAAAKRRLRVRFQHAERLESRLLLATAEGAPFEFSGVVDTSSLVGTFSASIDWGDGTVAPAVVSGGGSGALVGRVDYSYDTANFFDSQLKKDLFQQAVDSVFSRLGDDLQAIAPGGMNSWVADFSHPATGQPQTITDLQVSANEIVIFAGGRELGTTLGIGGPGGYSVSCLLASFCETVATRGEVGARSQAGDPPPVDFGPWGGSIAFDVTTDFYYSQTIDDIGTQQADFLSVAMHEVAHLLGFGASPAWKTYSTAGVYNGPASRVSNGGQGVSLSPDGSHWASGTKSNGQEVALDPSLTSGTRTLLTPLDWAGLDDVGWELLQPTATVSGSHVYGDDGVYEITLTLASSAGGALVSNQHATIINVAPMLTPASDLSVGFGQEFTIVDLGVFTDPGFGVNEAFSYTIDWGDGSTLGSGTASIDLAGSSGVATRGSYNGSHSYANGGIYDVLLTIVDDDGGSDTAQLQITVAPGLSVEITADQIAENDGNDATSVSITRHTNDLSQPLTVYLATDASEISIPSSVEFLAGEATIVVAVHAVDDDLLDGTQGVSVTATAPGFLEGRDNLIVVDHETLTLSVDALTVLEGAATFATATRSNTNTGAALEVSVSIDDPTEAIAPQAVIIPAGEQSVTFPIDAIEDGLEDGSQLVGITVTANGYEPATDSFFVADTLSWHNAVLRWDVNADMRVSPIDVLQIVNDLNRSGSRKLAAPGQAEVPPYLDVNDDGQVSPIDALLVINYLNNLGSGTEGESHQFATIAFDRVIWSPLLVTANIAPTDRDDWHRLATTDLEREIIFFADQLRNSFTDDLITDFAAAFDGFA